MKELSEKSKIFILSYFNQCKVFALPVIENRKKNSRSTLFWNIFILDISHGEVNHIEKIKNAYNTDTFKDTDFSIRIFLRNTSYTIHIDTLKNNMYANIL